jgi:hypothetical protein
MFIICSSQRQTSHFSVHATLAHIILATAVLHILLGSRLVCIQIRQEQGSESLLINRKSSLGGRMVHVNNESNLDPKVKWNHANERCQKGFGNGIGRKDNPIGQPLRLIIIGFQRLEGHVSRVDKAAKVDNQLAASKEHRESNKKGHACQEKQCLGLTSLDFQLNQMV